MEPIKLIVPTEEYLDQVWAYRQECREADSSMDGCGPLRFNTSPEQWLEDIRRYADPDTVPEGKVQATQFLAIRESDSRLVGMLQVRHCFNEYLEKYAGHIGYSVRPSERRKGYGKEQLRLALDFCKGTLGLDRVLITCKTENEASRRTILSAGGVYETRLRLYELEGQLAGWDFVRVSKSAIVNFDQVKSLRPDFGGRMRLTMSNGEVVVANRQYVPDIKKKLGL